MKIDFKLKIKFSILIILIWPFIFLFPITFGIIGIGNDFDLIYFSYKRYIAEMLANGIIPLWSPVEATGISLIFNPFAQFFYVPGWINYFYHFVTGNLTLHIYAIYTISAISIFSLGTYFWLKSFKFNNSISFLSALLIACSLKVTELLRFPNAAHAAAWMPWILYGINIMLINKIRLSFLIIFFCNLFILTAGYPYFIVYSLFLFIPYIIFIPIIRTTNKSKNFLSNLNFYFLCFIAFCLSYLVALPWLLKVKSFINSLVDRTDNNWEFATEHLFYWKDTVGSWIYPPAASTEGWYYQGILVTIFILFGLIYILLNNKKIVSEDKKLFIYSIIFIIFITYFSWGKNSFLFHWSWNNLPLIGSLRTWPRINIIIVPFIILLFTLSLKYFLKQNKEKLNNNSNQLIFIFLITFLSIFLLQLIFDYFDFKNQEYWEFWQKKRFDAALKLLPNFLGEYLKLYNGKIYVIYNIISLLFIIILIKFEITKKISFLAIIFIVSSELAILSNLQWGLDKWKTTIDKTENSIQNLRQGFLAPRIIDTVKGNEYFRDKRSFNINYPDNYGYNSHAEVFTKYFERYGGKEKPNISKQELADVRFFFGASDEAKKIFFSKSIEHNTISSFVNDSKRFELESTFQAQILLEKFNGNSLELNINTANDGWLSYIDNWDPGWTVFVNDKKSELNKLFNSYKSISIKKGFSKVKFEYKPW